MRTYEAPAKLNLSLHVLPPRADGYHPLESIVQTVEWLDELMVDEGEGSDTLDVVGADLGDEDNLVLRAVSAARAELDFPPLALTLEKVIPVAAGLGGGSSDAAAALFMVGDLFGGAEKMKDIGPRVGADVPLFLTGGTLMMLGIGGKIERLRALEGFAAAIVVPEFGLSTADVYARWDEMEGPEGDPIPDDQLPPPLRGEMPMRNDLLPAALSLEPRLGDFISDVGNVWGTALSLTGSGSACFGYFATVDEATSAATAVTDLCSVAVGVLLRGHGVARARDRS